MHISVKGVRKVYGKGTLAVEAIRSVSFQVDYGEFVSLLGPSGCGKSTLLMVVGGIIPASTGEVEIGDTVVKGPRAELGTVFQNPVLLPWRSVIENVLFPIETLKREKRLYRERALELLEMVGLVDFRHRLPRELSGGMQQRVAICRALIHDPQVLLMDEPFSALDAMTRDEMNLELMRIWQHQKKTILFVTHSIREAAFLSNRVLVMSRRPATLTLNLAITLPLPRELEVQDTSEFNRYISELRKAVQLGHHLEA